MKGALIDPVVKNKHLIISLDEFKNDILGSYSQNNLFTAKELLTFSVEKNYRSLAGRYLVKKCLFDLSGIPQLYEEVEILNNELGKPVITFSKKVKRLLDQKGIVSVNCSLSHSRNHATGMVALSCNLVIPDFKTISWCVEDGIGHMILNAPPANSMNKLFFDELKVLHTDIIPFSKLKALIVYGRGRHFSSGADLGELLNRVLSECNEKNEPEFLINNSSVFSCFEKLEFPVIAAIRGVCIGSALELALSCHFRFCEEGALLGLPESTFNIMPGCGGTQMLCRITGFPKAVELILEGRNISPEEAILLGIIDKITPRKQVVQFATNFAKELIAKKNNLVNKLVL